MMVNHKNAKEHFNYNPETGVFTHRKERLAGKKKYRYKIGDSAGYKNSYGYMVSKGCYLHRIAFVFMGDTIPKEVEHINRIRHDNRFINLRSPVGKNNQRNRSKNKNNTSGYNGVTFDRGKWKAEINVNSKKINLGRFKNKEDAFNARQEANKKFGFSAGHGKNDILY